MRRKATTSEKTSFSNCCGLVLPRVFGFIFVILVLPILLIAGFALRVNTGEPVLLKDEILDNGRRKSGIYRFRTTGSGNKAFSIIGRFFRSYSVDDFPAFWSMACGDVSVGEFLRLTKFFRLPSKK